MFIRDRLLHTLGHHHPDLAREVLWVETGNEACAFVAPEVFFREGSNHATTLEISLDNLADGRFWFWPIAVGPG